MKKLNDKKSDTKLKKGRFDAEEEESDREDGVEDEDEYGDELERDDEEGGYVSKGEGYTSDPEMMTA